MTRRQIWSETDLCTQNKLEFSDAILLTSISLKFNMDAFLLVASQLLLIIDLEKLCGGGWAFVFLASEEGHEMYAQ